MYLNGILLMFPVPYPEQIDVALTFRKFGLILGLSLPILIEQLVSTCSEYTPVTPLSVLCFASEA